VVGSGGVDLDDDAAANITMTRMAAIVFGLGGDDVLSGRGGANTGGEHELFLGLFGGGGGDLLIGGRGRDRMSGGPGHDQLRGVAGNDRLRSGPGHDEVNGGAGMDTCRGGTEDTKVSCER
jgi:Ca2+-binding RTX toxin-like protein